MIKKTQQQNKEQKCEHAWLPELFNYDSQVFGTDDKDEVFLESDIIIVKCSECGKYGYVIAEKVN